MNDAAINPIDKTRVADRFGRAAASYDRHDFLQREVVTRALERLDYVNLEPRAVLDLGSGTGRGARALAKRYRGARITQVDLAHGMLDTSREIGRAAWRERV